MLRGRRRNRTPILVPGNRRARKPVGARAAIERQRENEEDGQTRRGPNPYSHEERRWYHHGR